jgi:hypothetical protein
MLAADAAPQRRLKRVERIVGDRLSAAARQRLADVERGDRVRHPHLQRRRRLDVVDDRLQQRAFVLAHVGVASRRVRVVEVEGDGSVRHLMRRQDALQDGVTGDRFLNG